MKAIVKNITIDSHNEELVSFAQTIDFTAIFEECKKFLKVDCNFHQPEITETRGDIYINFHSDDITEKAGIFAFILEKCSLHSFSNRVYRDKETGEASYWVQVSLQYQHKDGGSNGMHVLRGWYTASKGWIITNAGDR